MSAAAAQRAQAAASDETPTHVYIPIEDKGSPWGVANIDADARILHAQLPDLSTTIETATKGKLDAAAADAIYARKGERPQAPAIGKLFASIASRNARAAVFAGAGSSTTEGWNASTPEKRWLNVLAGKLQTAYPLANGVTQPGTRVLNEALTAPPPPAGIQFVNAGVAGSTAAGYLTATTGSQLAALSPDVILHMVGSNDYAYGQHPSIYRQNLEARLDQLDAETEGTPLHVLLHQYERWDDRVAKGTSFVWSEYGDAMRTIATERSSNVVFFDLSPYYYMVGVPGSDPYGLTTGDKIHQNDAGHEFMADLIFQLLGIPGGAANAAAPTSYIHADITSDDFTTDSTTLTTRATDIYYGGTPAIPSESVAGTFKTFRGSLVVNGTGFLGYPTKQQNVEISARLTAYDPAGGTQVMIVSRRAALGGGSQARVVVEYDRLAQLELNGKRTGAKVPISLGDFIGIRSVGSDHELLVNGVTRAKASVIVPDSAFYGFSAFNAKHSWDQFTAKAIT